MGKTLTFTSSAFLHNEKIPAKYTCDENRKLSPPLSISGVPEGAKSLVLIMDDPDIPNVFKESRGIEAFDHWILFNIPPETQEIVEGTFVGIQGINSAGNTEYTGPCPPPEYEPSEHRYIFSLYALDTELSLSVGATKGEVLSAMQGHILEQAELIGLYKRVAT